MMSSHPKDLSIRDFSYDLPEERIAKYPLAERDQSKLLVYREGVIEERRYADIDSLIPTESLLVFNNTKVVEARLLFQKSTGSSIELFCLEPADIYPDITTAMLQKESVEWKCLVGGARKWKTESLIKSITHKEYNYTLTATKQEKINDYYLITFQWDDASLSFAEVLHHAGAIPLPPYMNREAEAADTERYQTIYAQHDGSVAAPTAGLHFTKAIFEKLEHKKIQHDFVTLHVGAGTFKPVKADTMEAHEMHAEFIDVRKTFIEQLLLRLDKPVIPVGTTSMRTLESLYWMGVKAMQDISVTDLSLAQWDAYEMAATDVSPKIALQCLVDWMTAHQQEKLITKTQIIIAPGYRFKIAAGLITNFHQPQSTLLLLVAALIGGDWKRVYQYALDNDFRFLSYGDGCLLWGKGTVSDES